MTINRRAAVLLRADIYVYLRARANNAIPGGRPSIHEDKPEAAKQAEASTGIK